MGVAFLSFIKCCRANRQGDFSIITAQGKAVLFCRYVDWEGELRSARPPQKKLASLLPAAAQAAVDGR